MNKRNANKDKMPPNTIAYLNGIKGLMCLPVLLGHFKYDFTVLPGLESLLDISCISTIIMNGNWALNIFFLISAFLIANSIFRNEELDYRSLSRKMVKRYFRLSLPLFVLYEIVWGIQKLGLFANVQVAQLLGTEKYLGQYFLKEYTQVGVFREAFYGTLFQGECTFNSVMWMMHMMFVGYYMALILALLIKWGGQRCIVIEVLLSALLLICNNYYTLFVAGVLLAFLSEKLKSANKKTGIVGVGCLILGWFFANYCYLIASVLRRYTEDQVLTSWYLYSKIGAILFVSGIVMNLTSQKVFSWKPFLWLNKISFPVFMFHRVIEGSVGSLIFLKVYEHTGLIADAQRMTWVSTLLVLFISSVLYAYLVEPLLGKTSDKIVKTVVGNKNVIHD